MSESENTTAIDPNREKDIISALSSDDHTSVRQAAFDAANAQLHSTLPQLVSLFASSSVGVQEACEFAVRKIRGRDAVDLVIPSLRTEDVTVRNIAMDILREISMDSLESIIALLEDDDPDIRIFSADILGSSESSLALAPLCKALLEDKEANVRYQAAISLGALKDPGAAEALRSAINDEEWVQYAVMEALAKIRDTSCVDILIQALETSSPLVSSMIMDALGDISNIKATPHLLRFIDKSNGPLRIKALKATIQILGPNSLALLGAQQLTVLQTYMLEALKERDDDILQIVLQGLASTGVNPEATKAVFDLVETFNSDLQHELLQKALECIIKIGHNEELESALTSENSIVRKLAIEACGTLEGKAGRFALKRHFESLPQVDKSRAIELLSLGSDSHDIPFFIHYLNESQDADILCAALTFLGSGQRYLPASPNMLELLSHSDPTVREAALEASLSLEDEQTVLSIVSLLNSENAEMRKIAVYTMGRINTEYFFDELTRALDDSCEYVRKTALQAIGYGLPPSEAKNNILILAISDDDREVRLSAVEMIGENVNEETIPALLIALSDSDDWVKIRALEALGGHKVVSAIPTIVEMMDNNTTLVQLKILNTLALIGGDIAFQALLSFLSYGSTEIQQAAQESIANITRELGAIND